METKEVKLCDALEEWRIAKTVEEYGKACMMDYGPSVVLPTAVLDRIVDAAHHLKLRTIDDLRKETRWSSTALYGTEVLAVVNKSIPQPQNVTALARVTVTVPSSCPVSQPQPPHSGGQCHDAVLPQAQASTSSSGVIKTRKSRCSACGLPGHNSKSSLRQLVAHTN